MTDTINGRTPEEIKRALGCCSVGYDCDECPYSNTDHMSGTCKSQRNFDALAYIQQLGAERDQYRRERDAAVKELRRTHNCNICKHHKKSGGTCEGWSVCGYNMPSWEWRGVQGVE